MGINFTGFVPFQVFFHSLDITKAEVHDVNYKKNINQKISYSVFLGDRGYLSESIQLNLFKTVNIKLETPKRMNQKDINRNLISLENQEKE